MSRNRVNRRQFLRQSSLIAMAPTVPAFLSRTVRANEGENNGRVLVVVQLSGGNDGVNTVVPYADEGYEMYRDKLRLDRQELIKINDQLALHPAMRPAVELLQEGRLAVVQGVGYPNPSRSHDVSMATWHSARFDPREHKTFGWIGRALDQRPASNDGAPNSILLGEDDPPLALRGRRTTTVSLARLDDLSLKIDVELSSPPGRGENGDLISFARRASLDARSTADLIDELIGSETGSDVSYPSTQLAGRFKSIAQMIKADFSTPVYYVAQSGYDTHASQLVTHRLLLRELAGGLKAFLDDLHSARLADRVVVVCFSEFGRRVQENSSYGTDHGTAGPVFVAGSNVKAGLIGDPPNLLDLDDGDLKMQFDFRRVYATVLENWLGIPSQAALGGSFDTLGFIETNS